MKIFRDKTVLITGHTGFKGSWLAIWLSSLGAKVIGMSLDIPSQPSNFFASNISKVTEDHRVDVRDTAAVSNLVAACEPDFVFHLAAQALVRPSYESPLDTFCTNAMGSVNVLEALRQLNKKVVAVMITSDKAYDNVEWVWGYRETDKLGGKDPYSASKGMAELAIRSYLESFFTEPNNGVRLGIARAGNVIGGGDWARDRIVADCIRSWSEGQVVDVRNPAATRPWQHVLEPLSGYLTLAEELARSDKLHGEAYNFGPAANQDHSVAELINTMAKYWDNVRWNNVVEYGKQVYEAGLLKLNCDKAMRDLSWSSTLNFEETVKMTMEWYKGYYEQRQLDDMMDICLEQILYYRRLAAKRELKWARK